MNTLLGRMLRIIEDADLRPSQVSAILGLSNSAFTDWGKGKSSPSLSAVVKFADYFNVSIDYLVHGCDFDANNSDKELLTKFHSLSSNHQAKVIGYIDGLTDASSDNS